MVPSLFSIEFEYELIPDTLEVWLIADIEMVSEHSCIVKSIRRIEKAESSLLPILHLSCTNGRWTHTDTGNDSRICTSIGQSIDRYIDQYRQKDAGQMKNQ